MRVGLTQLLNTTQHLLRRAVNGAAGKACRPLTAKPEGANKPAAVLILQVKQCWNASSELENAAHNAALPHHLPHYLLINDK